jgi:hypothetical protein
VVFRSYPLRLEVFMGQSPGSVHHPLAGSATV